MKRIIRLIVILTIVQGCRPKLNPYKTENLEHTITITETIKDTVIQVQPDSSIIQALIRCDSTGRARLEEIRTLKESARVQQTLALKDNRLMAKAIVDSMWIYLTYKERHKEEQHIQTIETIIEKEVNVIKWWQKGLIFCEISSIILIIASVIGRLIFHSKNISL